MKPMITSITSEGAPAAKLAAVTRREFINCAAMGGVAMSVMGSSSWAEERAATGMIYRTLGSTCQKVSAIGLGGFHIGNPELESESLKIIRSAIDGGIPGVEIGANDEGSPFQPVRGPGGPRDRGSPRSASGSRPGPDFGARGRRQPERLEEAQGPDGWGAPADHGPRGGGRRRRARRGRCGRGRR